jgi:hypothetical protein
MVRFDPCRGAAVLTRLAHEFAALDRMFHRVVGAENMRRFDAIDIPAVSVLPIP